MNNKQLIGIFGAILLIVGVFSPIVHIPIRGSITYIHNGKGDGVFILFFAALSLYYLLKERYVSVRWTGFASLGLLLFTFINFQIKISEMQTELNKDLSSNPFKGIANLAMQNIYIEWGFAVVLAGSALLILSSYIKNGGNQLDNNQFTPKQSDNADSNTGEPKSEYDPQTKTKKSAQYVNQTIQKSKITQRIKDDNEKNIDKILTRIQTSSVENEKIQEDTPHKKNHNRQGKYSFNHSTDESFLKKYGFKLAIFIIFGINVFLYFSGKPDKNEVEAQYKYVEAEASNSFEDKMGWGKVKRGANIEAVNIRIGKMTNEYSGSYPYPVPAIEISVKNIGEEKLKSFGINLEVSDIDNKRRVGAVGIASGSIDPGWISKRHILTLQGTDYSKLMTSERPIDFKMSLIIYVLMRGGETIKLYEKILDPNELKALPAISY